MHEGWQVRLLALSLYSPAVKHFVTHNLVGVVFGSPKYPGELAMVTGQMSMHTSEPVNAKVGTGQEETHNLV